MNCLVTEASWDGGPSSLLFRHIGILSSLGALPDISDPSFSLPPDAWLINESSPKIQSPK